MTTRVQIDHQNVLQDTIEGESVIINLLSGNYYSLENAASVIWRMLEQGASFSELEKQIGVEYDGEKAEIASAIQDFLNMLRKEGLIKEIPVSLSTLTGVPEKSEAGLPRKPFEAPKINVYTDMQDFLLVDPIHELDEGGLPRLIREDEEM